MDNNTLYTILQRYFKALSYTGYIQLQDLQYLIVLVYIEDIKEYIDQSIIDKALEIIKSKCIFYNNSFDIEEQEYCPIKDNSYSIDFFNVNLSSDKVKLNIGQGSNIKSVTIPSATKTLAGVMSSEDKAAIDKVDYIVGKNLLVDGLVLDKSGNNVSIGFKYIEEGTGTSVDNINLPIATQSTAGLITAEDRQLLNALKDNYYSQYITVKLTSSNNIIRKGVSVPVRLTWELKFSGTDIQTQDLNLNTDSIKLYKIISSMTNLLYSEPPFTQAPSSRQYIDTISDNTYYRLDFTYKGITKSVTYSINAYYPKIYGYSILETLTSADILNCIESGTFEEQELASTVTGTGSINVNTEGYVWFCVPDTMTIDKVTSGGFKVPMENPITVSLRGYSTYKCYRSTNKFKTGIFDYKIN